MVGVLTWQCWVSPASKSYLVRWCRNAASMSASGGSTSTLDLTCRTLVLAVPTRDVADVEREDRRRARDMARVADEDDRLLICRCSVLMLWRLFLPLAMLEVASLDAATGQEWVSESVTAPAAAVNLRLSRVSRWL